MRIKLIIRSAEAFAILLFRFDRFFYFCFALTDDLERPDTARVRTRSAKEKVEVRPEISG